MINRLLLVDPDADISTAKSCIVDIVDLHELEKRSDSLEKLCNFGTPYPLHSVILPELIKGVNYLLNDLGYDGHAHECMTRAVREAEKLLINFQEQIKAGKI